MTEVTIIPLSKCLPLSDGPALRYLQQAPLQDAMFRLSRKSRTNVTLCF